MSVYEYPIHDHILIASELLEQSEDYENEMLTTDERNLCVHQSMAHLKLAEIKNNWNATAPLDRKMFEEGGVG